MKICKSIGKSYANKKEYKQAFPYFKKACELESIYGCNWTGWIYRDGRGAIKDINKSIECYQKSADTNSTFAINMIGDIYKDDNQTDSAIKYYKLACDLNNIESCIVLGDIFYRFEKYKDVFTFIQKGFNNDDRAYNYLSKLYAKGDGRDRNISKAIEIAKKVIDSSEVVFSKNLEKR